MDIQLEKMRKLAGINQTEMARLLGVKVATYRTWEKGTRMLSLKQAYDCAVILNCSIDAIAGYTPPVSYADPAQEALNRYYECMNSQGRSTLVQSAKLMSGSKETRVEKNREEHVRVPQAVDRVGEVA